MSGEFLNEDEFTLYEADRLAAERARKVSERPQDAADVEAMSGDEVDVDELGQPPYYSKFDDDPMGFHA